MLGSDQITVLATFAQTNDALFAVEVRMPPGGGPPVMHRHAPGEIYYVTEGEFTFYTVDGHSSVRRVTAGVGEAVPLAGDTPHTVRNESNTDAAAFVVHAPGAADGTLHPSRGRAGGRPATRAWKPSWPWRTRTASRCSASGSWGAGRRNTVRESGVWHFHQLLRSAIRAIASVADVDVTAVIAIGAQRRHRPRQSDAVADARRPGAFQALDDGPPDRDGPANVESIGRPLPGRRHRRHARPRWTADGVVVHHSVDNALVAAGALDERVFVVAARRYLRGDAVTGRPAGGDLVEPAPPADTVFPDVDWAAAGDRARAHDGFSI